MKKIAVLAAMMGAVAAPAYAAGSNVQLYGLIDEGVTHFTGLKPAGTAAAGQTVSSTGLSSGVEAGSRIGVKGTEDLGGGVSTIFDVETGFCAAGLNQDGTTTQSGANQTFCTGGGFMQRQAWVGLAGDFGVVKGGRFFTQAFINEIDIDPFGAGLTGQISNLSLYANYGWYRTSQTIEYTTPKLSGFQGVAAYSFAPGNAGTVPTVSGAGSNVSRSWTLDGQYGNGPVVVGLNYSTFTNHYDNAVGVNDGALKLWQVYGSYNFRVAKLAAMYEQSKQDYFSGNDKFWLLGVTVPVGQGAILASYTQNKSDLVANGSTALPAGTAKQYALGYTYNLSKQTDLYVSYAHLSNDSASASQSGTSFAVGDSTDGFSGVTGQGSSGFAVGILHQF